MEPLVTIGIVMFNEERYIAQAIESVLQQSYKNIKLIISDNCSTDASYGIAEKYLQNDNRIELYRQEKNEGPVFNFEFVLQKINSPYFALLGAHDLLLPDYIQSAMDWVQREEIALVYPEGRFIDQDGNQLENITDDYDTTGMPIDQRFVKIATNWYNGYVIHGVFKTKVIKKLPVENIISPDFLMILLTNLYGTIKKLPEIGYERRVVRKETSSDQHERHIREGIYRHSEYNPYGKFIWHLSENIFKAHHISIIYKIRLILKLKKVIGERFGGSWKEIMLHSNKMN